MPAHLRRKRAAEAAAKLKKEDNTPKEPTKPVVYKAVPPKPKRTSRKKKVD